ncbi:hypothetical protein BDW22DRAFT_11593 [Trametopsis cervina]|nr:hypothetical protein BDW22DRAFT_11593 [Trametopsis cervina]
MSDRRTPCAGHTSKKNRRTHTQEGLKKPFQDFAMPERCCIPCSLWPANASSWHAETMSVDPQGSNISLGAQNPVRRVLHVAVTLPQGNDMSTATANTIWIVGGASNFICFVGCLPCYWLPVVRRVWTRAVETLNTVSPGWTHELIKFYLTVVAYSPETIIQGECRRDHELRASRHGARRRPIFLHTKSNCYIFNSVHKYVGNKVSKHKI